MEALTETVKTTTLTLDNEEAKWLRAIMQNPLFGQTPEEESPIDREMRKRFWDSLATLE